MSLAKLNTLAVKNYGHEVTALPATAALWVAELAAKEAGVNGWKIWKTISNARNRVGLGTAFPAYGSVCFNA